MPEPLFNKVAGPRPVTLLKKRLWHRRFPVNLAKFLTTYFLQSTSGRLLLCCTYQLTQNRIHTFWENIDGYFREKKCDTYFRSTIMIFFVLLLRISFKVPYGLNLTFWKIQKLPNSRLLDFNILEPPYTLTNVYVSGVYTMSILHYVNVQIVLRYIMFEWILTA